MSPLSSLRVFSFRIHHFRQPAGGTIATDIVAKAAPDGYTLLMASSSVMTNGPALIDLVAGHVFAHVDQISSALPYIQANRIRAMSWPN